MSRRAASPSRGRSRARSRARSKNSSSHRRQKSFEELFTDQQRVAKLRKQVQQQYPKRQVDDLVTWLGTAQIVVDAGKIVHELRTWGEASKSSDDFALKRRQLFASREDILQGLGDYPELVTQNLAILDQFLQGSVALVVDDVDCSSAKKQQEEWFARLQAATRHSTAMQHALQTKLADGAKTLLGSDSSTAVSLSQQWSSTDEALMAEERLLHDKTSLQVVRESVRCAVESADELRVYLARSKESWTQMHSFQLLSEHLSIFPELAFEDAFYLRLADVADIPLLVDGAAGEPGGPSHMVEIDEEALRDFRRLFRNAHKLHGNAIPIFVVLQGKVFARYTYEGLLTLNDFCKKYEVTEDYLNTVFASVGSAAAAFQRHVGRPHGRADADNIFVDVVAGGRLTLGAPHVASLSGEADMPKLTEVVENLAKDHALVFTPQRPMKLRVQCDSCFSLSSRSMTCPGGLHQFCEICLGNLIDSQTKQNGGMPQLSCPMPGCLGVWSDVELVKMLPSPQAEQASKRRRVHLETELRRELRREIQEELAAATLATAAEDGQLRQGLVTEALNLLVDQCRGCGQAFDDFDGCFAISCEAPCSRSICGYCLETGTSLQIHAHIASNDCPIRRQMFPDAQMETWHQGASKEEEFSTARKIRIAAEMHELFEGLDSRERRLLAHRIQRDVAENGVDLALFAGVLEEEPQMQV